MSSPEPLLDIDGLNVSFAGADHVGLRDASLTMYRGETLVLLGESGSGKSLLGAAVAGLLPSGATLRGSVRFNGHELVGMPEQAHARLRGRAIGFVPQSAGLSLNPVRTALSQVEEVFHRVQGHERAVARNEALRLMQELGLEADAARLHPHRMSGGMRQRVLVAIGLAARPALLIADEPSKGLDERLRDDWVRILRAVRVARPELALLIITHDLVVAEAVADRVGVLYAGVLVECGPAMAFFQSPLHPYARRLLAASPQRGLLPIPGAPPEPGVLIPGCPFEPRCERRTADCRNGLPPNLGDHRHLVLCRHPETAG